MVRHRIKVISFNMHKGFDLWGRSQLKALKQLISESTADIIFLQEVVGRMSLGSKDHHQLEFENQLEWLADQKWHFAQYGKNAIFPHKHHGNAILTRIPMSGWVNYNISETPFEGRGLLVCHQEWGQDHSVWLANTHLSLLGRDRKIQIKKIAWHLASLPSVDPLILAGDFNDWNQALTPFLAHYLDMQDAFKNQHHRYAKTFPSFWPQLCLDRIYFANCKCIEAQVLTGDWSKLSDHLPIEATFEW